MSLQIRERITEMSASAGGVSLAEVGGSYLNAWRAASKLVADGLIHRGRRSHRDVRFFACSERAKRWELAAKQVNQRQAAAAPAFEPGAEAIYPRNADGSPAYRHTHVPTPAYQPPRYARPAARPAAVCWA